MRVAIPYENDEIFMHFGKARQFKIYEIEDGEVKEMYFAEVEGSGHGALAGFLAEIGVDTVIAGGMGTGMHIALTGLGITVYTGISGVPDYAVMSLLEGELEPGKETDCGHHASGQTANVVGAHGGGGGRGGHGHGGSSHGHGGSSRSRRS